MNGGFESSSNVPPPNYPSNAPGSPGSGGLGQIDYNTSVTGWSSPDVSYVNQTGYNFLLALPAAETGVIGYNGGIAVYGPLNGFNNGLTASPDGGNFIGADGDTRYHGRIEQNVSGLVVGQSYKLTFDWALAQQYGAGGMPFARWDVTFGSASQMTNSVTLPVAGGFVPWRTADMTFTATGTSQVLSFLADEGGPYGGPPFVLLDGVKLTAVPEPTSLSMVAMGLLGLVTVLLRRRAMSRPAVA